MYPVLFSFGPVSFYTYGFVVAIGFFSAVLVLMRLVEKASLNLQFIADHFFSLLVFSILGARFLYVMLFWEEFSFDFLKVVYFWEGGFIAVGGIIAFLALFYYFTRQNQEDFSRWMDVLIGPAVLWSFFESIAAFLAGKSFGLQTTLPWGIQFENPEMPYAGIPVHPTQIYSAVVALGIFLWIRAIWTRTSRPVGIGYLGGAVFMVSMFVVDFTRGDFVPVYFGLRATQIIELLLAILFVSLYFRIRNSS